MQMVFINECKSCDISNIIFNVMFSFFGNKRKTGYDTNIAKSFHMVYIMNQNCV